MIDFETFLCYVDLHSLWDTYLIAKAVRLVPENYSQPLPFPQVEKALRGTIYDSYIRRILWEGILNPWAEDLPKWLTCPAPKRPRSGFGIGLLGMWENIYAATTQAVQKFMKDGVEISPDGPVVCPYFWAKPTHQLNCAIVWPPELDEPPFNVRFPNEFHSHFSEHGSDSEIDPSLAGEVLDLDTPEYAGVIKEQMLVEKLLAQGGIRLAGVLNYIFSPDNSMPGAFVWTSLP